MSIPFAVPALLLSLTLNAGARDLLTRGQQWAGKGEWAKALADYDAAVHLHPNSAAAFHRRGEAWEALGRWPKALDDYSEAIRLDPKYVVAFNDRAVLRAKRGNMAGALRDLNTAIQLDPSFAKAFHNRGAVSNSLGRYDKAIDDCTESIRLDPTCPLAFSARGLAQVGKKEYAAALEDYDEAIRLDPKYPTAYANRALLRGDCEDLMYRNGTKAVADATRACDLTEWKKPECLEILAVACAEAGRYDEAVKWQKKALEDVEFAKQSGDIARARLKMFEAGRPLRPREMAPSPRTASGEIRKSDGG